MGQDTDRRRFKISLNFLDNNLYLDSFVVFKFLVNVIYTFSINLVSFFKNKVVVVHDLNTFHGNPGRDSSPENKQDIQENLWIPFLTPNFYLISDYRILVSYLFID